MEDIEANKEAPSQAVETLMATTAQAGAGRKRKASSKTTDNIELEKALKKKQKRLSWWSNRVDSFTFMQK
jgi:hypothetical protein